MIVADSLNGFSLNGTFKALLCKLCQIQFESLLVILIGLIAFKLINDRVAVLLESNLHNLFVCDSYLATIEPTSCPFGGPSSGRTGCHNLAKSLGIKYSIIPSWCARAWRGEPPYLHVPHHDLHPCPHRDPHLVGQSRS